MTVVPFVTYCQFYALLKSLAVIAYHIITSDFLSNILIYIMWLDIEGLISDIDRRGDTGKSIRRWNTTDKHNKLG